MKSLRHRRFLPFNDTDAYRFLKVATEAFLLSHTGVPLDPRANDRGSVGMHFDQDIVDEVVGRLNAHGQIADRADLERLLQDYLVAVEGIDTEVLPYLAAVQRRLRDVGVGSRIIQELTEQVILSISSDGTGQGEITSDVGLSVEPVTGVLTSVEKTDFPEGCYTILDDKLTSPLLIELIWSYWHEEGMLVQAMNTIGRRFQNIRTPGSTDPLANLEVGPLRPLNNLLWGFVQDEQHRLTLRRRAYEYDHEYGISLVGKAVPDLNPADSRTKFLEAFHVLLYLCHVFYQQDDETTVVADGFPILNGLKEVHLLLTQGAHNQFGDLPSTSRQEMLMQQWLLARPEFREFLPSRTMVAYPEDWMDRVDTMKALQGWTNTSVIHFHNLAEYGEQILLSIRYGNWSKVSDSNSAANWARFWRQEIQGYVHAYRATTGVELTAEVTNAASARARDVAPSIHLQRKLTEQHGGIVSPNGTATAVGAQSTNGRKRPQRSTLTQ